MPTPATDETRVTEALVEVCKAYGEWDQPEARRRAETTLRVVCPHGLPKAFQELVDDPAGHPCGSPICAGPEASSSCPEWGPCLDEIQVTLGSRNPAERVPAGLAMFFVIHCKACELWEDSFEYGNILCLLEAGRQVVQTVAENAQNASREAAMCVALAELSQAIRCQVLIENGMIGDDPTAMAAYVRESGGHMDVANRRLEAVRDGGGPARWLSESANGLLKFVGPNLAHHGPLRVTAEQMELYATDRGAFLTAYPRARPILTEALTRLDQEENNENASELRAHLKCLDRLQVVARRPALRLEQVKIIFMFGFFYDVHGLREPPAEDPFDALSAHFRDTKATKDFPVRSVSHDPLADIFKTGTTSEHFGKNLMLSFPEVTVNPLPLPDRPLPLLPSAKGSADELVLRPRLIHYALGVGIIVFEGKVDVLSVSDFQVVKNLCCPHSPHYVLHFAGGEEDAGRTWTQLLVLARDLAHSYVKAVREWAAKHDRTAGPAGSWVEPEQAWFGAFRPYRISTEEGTELDADAAAQHPEWPGIIAYPRADRASVNDWAGLDLKELQLTNLAGVCGHCGDTFVLSENHAVYYLPDDPEFVVLDYDYTAKWVFLIRVLVAFCLARSEKMVGELQQLLTDMGTARTPGEVVKEEELRKHEECIHQQALKIQGFNALALSAVNYVAWSGVSQYPDHGLLLRRALVESGVHGIGDALLQKVAGLDAGLQAVTAIPHRLDLRQRLRVQEQRESIKLQNESQRRGLQLAVLALFLGLFGLVQSYDVVATVFHGGTRPGFRPWCLGFLVGLALLALLVGVIYVCYRTVVYLCHRLRLGRKRSSGTTPRQPST